jgi:hypothetical protein
VKECISDFRHAYLSSIIKQGTRGTRTMSGNDEEAKRAAIMAEYLGGDGDDDDDEDEAEFDPDDDDDSEDFDDDDDEDEDGDYDGDGAPSGSTFILMGSFSWSDKHHLIYKGTWKDKRLATSTLKDNPDDASSKNNFKLKSKQQLAGILDLSNPTAGSRAPVIFDGAFTIGGEQPSSVQENSVQLSFFPLKSGDCGDGPDLFESYGADKLVKFDSSNPTRLFGVTGSGMNQLYGAFQLEGEYKVVIEEEEDDGKKAASTTPVAAKTVKNALVCEKIYQSSSSRKRRRSEDEDDDDSDGGGGAATSFPAASAARGKARKCDDDEPANISELKALYEEATMTVDELRQRYLQKEDDVIASTISQSLEEHHANAKLPPVAAAAASATSSFAASASAKKGGDSSDDG